MLIRWLVVVLIVLYAILFFWNLGRTGFLGPDEPRYASIGRDMARTWDWVTPRLDGQPWFEKPPLTYWLTAASRLAHLPDEWAARFPQALISLAFFYFYFRILRQEFSIAIAIVATAMLATSIGWLAFTYVAVTDLPMAATLNLAVLITMFPHHDPRTRERWLNALLAGALLGVSALGKGFVPIVLFAPVLIIAKERFALIAGAIVTAAPWYVWCYQRNGEAFWNELFWKHHVARFLSPTLDHVQPFWFYLPMLALGIFPWTPLLALLGQPRLFEDSRAKMMGAWVAWGLIFFSASRNKLPGYVLPLLPVLIILITIAFSRSPKAAYWLAACAWMAAWLPTASSILPNALLTGLSRALAEFSLIGMSIVILLSLMVAAAAAFLMGPHVDGFRAAPLLALAAAVTIGVLLTQTAPVLDRYVSVRRFYRSNPAAVSGACLDRVNRTWEYGLNYYAGHPLERCGANEPAGRRFVRVEDGRLVLGTRDDQ